MRTADRKITELDENEAAAIAGFEVHGNDKAG